MNVYNVYLFDMAFESVEIYADSIESAEKQAERDYGYEHVAFAEEA